MGIPGLYKFISYCEPIKKFVNEARYSILRVQNEKTVILVDGVEILFHVTKSSKPKDWNGIVDGIYNHVVNIYKQLSLHNKDLDKENIRLFISFSGVYPKTRLYTRRDRAYMEQSRPSTEFPSWFKPYEVAAGIKSYEDAIGQLAKMKLPLEDVEISFPNVPGPSLYKIENYISSKCKDCRSIIYVGTGADMLASALRQASKDVKILTYLVSARQRMPNVIDVTSLATGIASMYDEDFELKNILYAVNDFVTVATIIGGTNILPRPARLDVYDGAIETGMKVYMETRRELKLLHSRVGDGPKNLNSVGRLNKVVGKKLLPNYRNISLWMVKMASHQNERLTSPPEAIKLNDDGHFDVTNYCYTLDWVLRSTNGVMCSWTWEPPTLKKYAPNFDSVGMSICKILKGKSPHIRYNDVPDDAVEQLSIVLPPVLHSMYLPNELRQRVETVIRRYANDYPKSMENMTPGRLYSRKTCFHRKQYIPELQEKPLLKLSFKNTIKRNLDYDWRKDSPVR